MSEIKELIKRFESSEDLRKIEKKLNEFNPFKVLDIGNHEIRHSNIIA